MNSESGPDLASGVPFASIPDGGTLRGQLKDDAVVLARRGNEVFAIGATCAHYGAPLADGLVVGDTIRCPWHHACFSLRTGEPLAAPALDGLTCWRVEQRDGNVYLGEKVEPATSAPVTTPAAGPESVVIVGGGGAGNAAAEMLRRSGYAGNITMLSADSSLPCDRPNLSKGFLSGAMPEESNILRSAEFYRERHIDVKLNARVTAIDTKSQRVTVDDGTAHTYGALLLATGADPIRLRIPGSDLPHVHYLRTVADSKSIVAAATSKKRAVVIGASFIGLEVAASLRAREVEVHVVAPEKIPMEKIMGPDIGSFIRTLHEHHAVNFRLGTTVVSIDAHGVSLENGENLAADFVVVGIGVRPSLALAEQAGLAVDRGVIVDDYLETSVPGIFAAGDIARWPDHHTGERIRVEHWVVAERQGQVAARNILGARQPYESVPFFWTDQYDLSLAYVGHAERWDKADFDGTLAIDSRDCAVTYSNSGKKLAVATVYRDSESLRAELEFERA